MNKIDNIAFTKYNKREYFFFSVSTGMQRKHLIVLGLVGGGLLIIGGWIFLYRSLTASPEDLQANIDIHNEQDTKDSIQLPTNDTTQENIAKDTPSEENQDISLDTNMDTTVLPGEPITVIVPPHINTEALQNLRKQIYKTHTVLAEFQQAKTFQAYEESIHEQHGKATVDMILIPSNRFETYQDRGIHIPTKQPLSPLFHPALQKLVDNTGTTFVPFSIDPYVTIYNKRIPLPKDVTIGHLQQQLLPLVAKEVYSIPMSFGITSGDLFLLAQGKQAYHEYADIIYILLAEAVHTRNTYIIEYFLQTMGRNTKSLLTLSREKQQQNVACMTLPHICLLQDESIGISFSRLSSLALGKKLFDRNYSDTYALTNFPVSKNQYPVTSRGFVVNKKSTHLSSVSAWLRGYLEHAGFGNIPLWPYTLSAFNNVYKQQEIQAPYTYFLPYVDSFYVLRGKINPVQEIAEDKNLQAMLAGEYSKIIYIKEHTPRQSE